MLEHYLERTQVLSLHEITLARAFVEKQSKQAERALERSEARLMEFRRKNRVVELAAEQQNRTQQFVDLESKSAEARDNILRLETQIRTVRAQLARYPRERVVATGEKNPNVGALQAKLAQVRVERAASLELYQSDSTQIRTLDAQIATLEAQLAREPTEVRVPLHVPNERYDKLLERLDSYQTELEGASVLSAGLEAQLRQKRGRLNQLGPWEVRMVQLQRDRDMAEKSYLSLANRLQDLQIRENARRSTARIIENAVPPPAPIRPRRVVNLVLSLLVGALVGCGLAFVLEALDDRVASAEDVDRLLALPVLGHIPTIGEERHLISALPPHSPVAESYRGLRASISFSAVDTPLTTMAVTSAHAGEGKSTTAVNLAMAMAIDGRRVILVDTDLRRPNLHRLLGVPSSPGVTNVLTGQCSLDEALQPIGDFPLQVLTSGPIPPNPSELLNTAGMETLIQQLRERADIVIFDTPPCVPITDAQILGARLDGLVLVAETGATRKGELRRARELMERAHVRVLGIVLNKLRQQDRGYYYHYAYYHADEVSNGHTNGKSLRRRTDVASTQSRGK
jgi:tyrosine-protein kinase Etk/Wzc